MRFGSIIIWSIPPEKLKGFNKLFDILQNFFTKMPQTHASILLDKVEGTNMWYEYEATTTVRISLYSYNEHSEIYEIIAPTSLMKKIFISLYHENNGKVYNILQTLYFAWRWFFELFGFRTTKWFNPFGMFGLICSELVYLYLMEIATTMSKVNRKNTAWKEVVEYLNNWNQDTFHAGDVWRVIKFMERRNLVRQISDESHSILNKEN